MSARLRTTLLVLGTANALDITTSLIPSPADAMVPWLEAHITWSHVLLLADVGAAASVLLALGLLTHVAVWVVLFAFLVTQNQWFRATVFHDDWLYFVFPLLVLGFAVAPIGWRSTR